MRYLPVLFACLPAALWAEDIPLQSHVSDVTLYPQGATITREVTFSAPAGQHQLILTDLPRATPLERVRVQIEGATMGSVTARRDFVPPVDPQKSAAIEAAEAERGADRIDMPEQEVVRRDGAFMLRFRPRRAVERHGAAMSLATNMAVADALFAAVVPHDAGCR